MPAAAILVAALLCCFSNAWPTPGGICTIRLRSEAVVKGSTLILADIADLSGDDEVLVTRLAQAPLGVILQARTLSRAEVFELIRGLVASPKEVLITGADCTRVSVATRVPALEEIVSVLKAHFASVTEWRQEEIEIPSIENLTAIELPQGELKLNVIGRALPSNNRSMLIPMAAVSEGRTLRTFWVKADVRVRAHVVQLAKPVPYAHTLQADDLRDALADIEEPGAAYFRTCEEVIGTTAKRALGTGELLKRDWVNEINLVHSGDTVRLVSQGSAICVTTLARALQNGKIGDRIKVRNLDSDRAIAAVVTGQGEVRVAR
ncbi:MAG: flagellar basal body P-ring formation chaperone FlgA [Acidobacteriota bacterium]